MLTSGSEVCGVDGAVVPSGHRTLPMVTVALSISASGGACQEISSGVQCVVQGAIFSPDICPAELWPGE